MQGSERERERERGAGERRATRRDECFGGIAIYFDGYRLPGSPVARGRRARKKGEETVYDD